MEKILFIYNNPLDGSYGGSQRTRQALAGLKNNFNVLEYSCVKKSNKFITLFRNICGFSGNLSRKDCKEILKIINQQKINYVFFDVCLHGLLVKEIKKTIPQVKIIVNYHNCEAKYFGDMFRTKGLPYYPIYRAAVRNEKLSITNADFNVFITDEDRRDLNVESNYTVIPVTLKDNFNETECYSEKDMYFLFIGAAQYANIEAAKFIIEELAPNINRKFMIVGKGMKSIFQENYENVTVMDFVPSLNDVFKNAVAFISPLFYGSGAKIKVAEALMHGKKIIGTTLTFYGYEMENAVYEVCNTKEQFINSLTANQIEKTFYEENRKLYLEKYCDEQNSNYYSKILSKIKD